MSKMVSGLLIAEDDNISLWSTQTGETIQNKAEEENSEFARKLSQIRGWNEEDIQRRISIFSAQSQELIQLSKQQSEVTSAIELDESNKKIEQLTESMRHSKEVIKSDKKENRDIDHTLKKLEAEESSDRLLSSIIYVKKVITCNKNILETDLEIYEDTYTASLYDRWNEQYGLHAESIYDKWDLVPNCTSRTFKEGTMVDGNSLIGSRKLSFLNSQKRKKRFLEDIPSNELLEAFHWRIQSGNQHVCNALVAGSNGEVQFYADNGYGFYQRIKKEFLSRIESAGEELNRYGYMVFYRLYPAIQPSSSSSHLKLG